MKKIVSLLVICLFCRTVLSQVSTITPSSSSIAQTSVADKHNWSAFGNPAMLGYLEQSELGFQFENRYLLNELSTKSIEVGLASKLMCTGISFSHFGYSQYHEMLVGIGFARNFSNKFALGVQANYFTTYFSASNSYRSTFFPQVGLSVQLSPTFSIGFNASNPFQSTLKTEYVIKRLPSVFSLGTEYLFSPELIWRTQIDKEVSSNYRYATGFDYMMLEKLAVKIGAYGSDYLVPCLGMGLKTGSFLIDLNCELHPLLGLNTFAAIHYCFRK
ncbi:MAG TPA: hypothetical protein VFC36_08740 [Paludibacter sp.]|nr:hypothetical protein [Paludibacter sp.]